MPGHHRSSHGSSSSSRSGPSSRRPSEASIAESISNLIQANMVYYPSWRSYRGETPATLNMGCISHVLYAFVQLGPDGSVFFGDEWADLQAPCDGRSSGGCVGSLLDLKKAHPHLRLLLSIGGAIGSTNFSAVASHAATRDTFGKSAKALVDASGFDGIDIDWEHPSNATDGRNFMSLLAAVRLYMPDKEYLVTAALPAGQWALQFIDLRRARHYLDFLNLMAYDFYGPWSKRSGHHAQLYAAHSDEPSGAAAVDYVIGEGFSRSKIILGIPVYGRSFLGAGKAGDRFTGSGGEEGTFDFKMLPRQDTDEEINTKLVAASCSGGDGGFVSYDNPETVGAKAKFCKSKKLGGLFYWTGAGDVRSGSRSLIATGFKGLHYA